MSMGFETAFTCCIQGDVVEHLQPKENNFQHHESKSDAIIVLSRQYTEPTGALLLPQRAVHVLTIDGKSNPS